VQGRKGRIEMEDYTLSGMNKEQFLSFLVDRVLAGQPEDEVRNKEKVEKAFSLLIQYLKSNRDEVFFSKYAGTRLEPLSEQQVLIGNVTIQDLLDCRYGDALLGVLIILRDGENKALLSYHEHILLQNIITIYTQRREREKMTAKKIQEHLKMIADKSNQEIAKEISVVSQEVSDLEQDIYMQAYKEGQDKGFCDAKFVFENKHSECETNTIM